MVAVDEIEPRVVVDAGPHRMRRPALVGLSHPVPSHVRDLQRSRLVSGRRRGFAGQRIEAHAPSRDQAEARSRRAVGTLVARVGEHLFADADAEQRLRLGARAERVDEAGLVQVPHAVAHRALPGQHETVGRLHVGGRGRDPHVGLGRDVTQRLGDAAQVAHPVIDDDDHAR